MKFPTRQAIRKLLQIGPALTPLKPGERAILAKAERWLKRLEEHESEVSAARAMLGVLESEWSKLNGASENK